MRMRIDEAGNRAGSARIEIVVDRMRIVAFTADVGDALSVDDDHRVFVNAQIAQRAAALRLAANGRGDLGEVADEKHQSVHPEQSEGSVEVQSQSHAMSRLLQ